ncbi:zinc finger BED domain-containing protein RICESLEEPER 2-like protein [Tanacetum coccineum]
MVDANLGVLKARMEEVMKKEKLKYRTPNRMKNSGWSYNSISADYKTQNTNGYAAMITGTVEVVCLVELLIDSITTDLEYFDNNPFFAKEAKESFNKSFEGLWDIYFAKYGNPTPLTSSASSSRSHTDVLSVQATSVASESVFSTSGRALSNRRTRLTPAFMEMCMCLKDHLDATDRIQHISNLENTLDFEEGIYDKEVQTGEAITLSDEEIAQDEASIMFDVFPF